MASTIFWWTGIAIEILILWRSLRQGTFLKYPLFYTYIACVLLVDASSYIVYTSIPSSWRSFYWSTQFLSLLVGYGVILEILRKCLDTYPGAERFGRFVVLTIFALVFGFVASSNMTRPDWSPAATTADLERDLRAVQVFVLAGILGVVFYYRIALGRNLKGMIGGYGLFIGTNVMNLAVRVYAGARFDSTWKMVTSYSYLVSLLIWTVALWSYRPNPAVKLGRMEEDYHALAMKTRGKLTSMRALFGRVARS